MADFFTSQEDEPVSWSICLYSASRRDRVLFEQHAFSMAVGISLCCLLLGSRKLSRIYMPLYNIVNTALVLQLAADVLFFASYPYSDKKGNCTEIGVGRFNIVLVMFGELHQLYFIANVLGLNRLRVLGLSLEQGLRIATILAVASILLSVFIKRLFMMIHDIWSLVIVAVQLYFIAIARKGAKDSNSIVDARSDAIHTFEALSWLQIIPTCVALLDRVLEFDGVFLNVSLDGVMLILEGLAIYLFYIKILVLQEKASKVTVEVV